MIRIIPNRGSIYVTRHEDFLVDRIGAPVIRILDAFRMEIQEDVELKMSFEPWPEEAELKDKIDTLTAQIDKLKDERQTLALALKTRQDEKALMLS